MHHPFSPLFSLHNNQGEPYPKSDLKIVSGESGAVDIGLLETMMRETGAAEIKSSLGLNKNSVVLIFNTEGDTDPNNYLRVINS
jgi:diaminopropionate ammonia-lyase